PLPARRRHQSSPEELKCGADVGRLLASGSHAPLPDRLRRSVADEHVLNCYPLQWRGRTGITPVSVSRVRIDRLSRECYRSCFSWASAAASRDLSCARSTSYAARCSGLGGP